MMYSEEKIIDFIKFLESNFNQNQLKIVKVHHNLVTADIDCLLDENKILTLFITSDDIALARNSKYSLHEDSFMPFDERIENFTEAKKQIIQIKEKGK